MIDLSILADALKCYQCESENEYDCGEFFDSKHADVGMTDCPLGNAQYCIKTTGIFSGISCCCRNWCGGEQCLN